MATPYLSYTEQQPPPSGSSGSIALLEACRTCHALSCWDSSTGRFFGSWPSGVLLCSMYSKEEYGRCNNIRFNGCF